MRQALTLAGTQKFVDDGIEETLGTVDGITLKHLGPFIYATGNGAETVVNYTTLPKLVMPAYVAGGTNARYGYGSGLIDSWYHGISKATFEALNGTVTVTQNGGFREFSSFIGGLGNGRPYCVALLGDSGSLDYHSITIAGTQKQGIVQPADDYAGGVLRYASRQAVSLASGSGSITVSRWGNVACINIYGVTCSLTGDPFILATLPESYRPSVNTSIQLANHNGGRYFTCIAAPNGNITVYNPGGATLSDACGGGMIKTSNAVSSNPPLFSRIPLTLNGTQKYLWQMNAASNYTCEWTTATNATGTSGTLYLYKIAGFVFGSAVSYATTATGALNGTVVFTAPVGYRPKEAICYNTGCGWQYASNAPVANARVAAQISSGGEVAIWTMNASVPNTNMGLSFYYEAAL
jgi:hypothetical protein